MAEKVPTQGMPGKDQRHGPRDADGANDGTVPRDKRGAGDGGPIGPKHADKDFHGGQTGAAYHGHGQLGEDEVEGQGNANSVSEDP